MTTWLVTDATTRDGSSVDIAIEDGAISRLEDAGSIDPSTVPDDRRYDADGRLVTPTLTEPHLHLDATLTAGEPRWNESGTLAEGIGIWGERKRSLEADDVKARAEQAIEWLAANGVTRVRTHADTTETSLTGVRALIELREDVADLVDLQVVAFPQDGVFTDESHEDLLREALEMGADVVGAIPHNEHTREDGVASVELAMDLAERYDRPVDAHIDETDDPGSRFTEVLASESIKRGIGDRVTASHTTAMHSYPNSYAAKVISLLAESDVDVVTNPPDNAVLQGRYDDYPRRRGHTRIDELRDAGVTVGLGHDSVMDPWYHYGRGDPLDAAFVLLHYAHMSGRGDVEPIWEMLTEANAEVFGVDDYGLAAGAEGSLVVYDAPDPFNALRTQAPRTLVLKDGREIARTEPASTRVIRENGDEESDRSVDFHR
ncbi:amidohydrolase family protein [Natronorubrum sp. JWXQ-INN-674]|uniref:Amidohydrolase family protein n=1 Tax=Natronorubrum halalkaliphilum TaxID=2691917 RepID=A0A6B0VNS5_9EURY|nr:cytosine deaminase [Natronorubrum halalkaliphilum]MXV62626.1 amidohydrolase family protein [Natronorubrum halalkaliphilum]